jgi:hypothetical protein
VGLTSPASSSPTNSFSASWALPADAGSPIVAARYQLCQNGSCGPVSSAPSTTSVTGLALAAAGTAVLRVWLVDELGHEDANTAAAIMLTYAPAIQPPDPTPRPPDFPTPQPQPQPGPATPKADAKLKITAARRTGRRLAVSGTLTAKAAGHVTVRYRARLHGRTRTVTKRVSIARHAFRTTLTLSKAIASVHWGTASVFYGGDSDTKSASRSVVIRLSR